MIARNYVQLAALALALVGIFVWSIWAARNRPIRLYAVAPISWLMHVAIFYTVVLIDSPFVALPVYSDWSAVLRLHGVFLMLGAGVLTCCMRRGVGR